MLLKEKLEEKARPLEPTLRIGKFGLTEGVVLEIKKQLRAKKLIKIKLLKACMAEKDRKEITQEIAQKTGAELIHQVGFVAVFYKDGL